MTLNEFYNAIATLGYPVAYDHFPIEERQSLPYAVYYSQGADTIGADNRGYLLIDSITVEVYTKDGSIEVERDFEEVFDGLDIYFTKSKTYISDENMFEVIYEMELI